MYQSLKSWNNPEDILLSWKYAKVLKSYTHQQEYQEPSVDRIC